MSAGPIFPFATLPSADLVVDAVYAGGTARTAGDDALARLLPVGNQGGFRPKGSPREGTVLVAALYTSGAEVDWPDVLDAQTGVFTYFGDDRQPGRELHQTQRGGNLLLRDVFEWSHGAATDLSGTATTVGVRDVARLVSRIRHREFGVFVTTSYIAAQAYSEVRADGHPVALVCGQDIVDALKAHGFADALSVRAWLDARDNGLRS